MEDILTELSKLKADHKAATDLLDATASEIEGHKALISQYTNDLTQAIASVSAKDAELASLHTQLEAYKGQVATLQASHKTAEEKAVAIVAAQGVAPMVVKTVAAPELTKQEALEQYKALLGTDSIAAGTFYQNNKALFRK